MSERLGRTSVGVAMTEAVTRTGAKRGFCAATATLIVLFLSCRPVLAQSGPSSPATDSSKKQETVIVTGQRPQQDIDSVVSQFVDLHAATNRKTGQYMRDDVWPVCPITVGLPEAFNAFVTARVVQVAASVGAKADASGKCKPNVEILFTDQPKAVVRQLEERTRGAILGMHFLHEAPRLLEVTHPIQGWYVTGTRMDENAIEPVKTVGTDDMTRPADTKTPAIDSAYHNAPDRITTGSLVPNRRISSILNVLIVADTRKLAGAQIGPISDYVAMLALSQPRSLDQCNELPSILDLFSSDCGARAKPDQLTESDIAYLKGLYAADLGATTNSVQKKNIESGMEHQLSEAPATPSEKSAKTAN